MVEFKQSNSDGVIAVNPDLVLTVTPIYKAETNFCAIRMSTPDSALIVVAGSLDSVTGSIREASSRYALQKIAERIQWP